MKTPRLTEQQRRALETRGVDVALSAGAGCGKTFVLARRLLGEIRPPDGRDLSRVVALTFTNKAARELRERVRSQCRAEARDADPDLRNAWLKLVRELEAAPISTFHVFCKGILKRFAAQAGVDPGFELLEGPLGDRRRRDAVERTLRDALANGDVDLRPLAVEQGLGFVQTCLSSLLLSQDFEDVARSRIGSDEVIRRWERAFREKLVPALLDQLAEKAEAALEQLESGDCSHNPRMAERKANLLELLPRVIGRRESDAVRGLLPLVRENATVQYVNKWPDREYGDALREVFKDLRESIDKSSPVLELDPDASRGAAAVVARLSRLSGRLAATYEDLKRSEGLVDYSDLLLKTRELLRTDAAGVREALAAELDAILIDEFQDTDPIQEEIVRAIAGPDRLGGRLYVVGDVKQSIYGFRGARPDLFARLSGELPPEGRLPLTENFRSVPGVLRFVNALFEHAFAEPYEPLVPNRNAPDPERSPVVFLWGEPHDKMLVAAARRLEGARIAAYLRDLLDSGRTVRDRETGTIRPAKAGDVALLFRSMTDLAPYERALSDVGLDYHVVGGRAFYAQQEIADICNVLTVVEDPRHPVALAGALRGPFFSIGDEALFHFVNAGRRDLYDGLLAACAGGAPGLSPRDRVQAERALALLDRWRSLKDRVPIGTLVDRVFDESGFEAALVAEPLGDRKRANARKVARLARSYDAEGGLSLADFVERLREDLRTPPREGEAATTDESGDVVRLMSIHQSKGLEFPIVVLPDLDRSEAGSLDVVAVDPEIGLVVNAEADPDEGDSEAADRNAPRNIGWLVHERLRKERERAESLRVFYVATTRARDLLILSSASNHDARPVSAAMELLESRFDRRTGDLRGALPPGWDDPRVEAIVVPDPAPDERRPRPRPDLIGVSRLVRDAAPGLAGFAPIPAARVDRTPARLDALLRLALKDVRLYHRDSWREVVERAARALPFAASRKVVDELTARLERWIVGPFGLTVSKSSRVVVARALPDPEAATRETWLDLAYQSRSGDWNIVGVSLIESDDEAERVRVERAAALWTARVDRLWSLRLGEGGGLIALKLSSPG